MMYQGHKLWPLRYGDIRKKNTLKESKVEKCKRCNLPFKENDKTCSECKKNPLIIKNYDFIDSDENQFICPDCVQKVTGSDDDFCPVQFSDLDSCDDDEGDGKIYSVDSLVKMTMGHK